MSWGIVTLTVGGLALAQKIRLFFPGAAIYTTAEWEEPDTQVIHGRLKDFTGILFRRHTLLIFIMAAGIVVRCIARHLKDKTIDPGILVMDEKGEFAVSLLSGHIGGANAAAKAIAEKTGAVAVITTASDVTGKIAVDHFAMEHDLIITDMNSAKTLTAMMVNGGKVAVTSDLPIPIPECFHPDTGSAAGLIIITNKSGIRGDKPFVQLIPRNLIVGIGCKSGISSRTLIRWIENTLYTNSLDRRAIKFLASVDLKTRERAILDTARYFNCQIRFIHREAIREIETQFSASSFVKEKIGISAVAEPSAYLAGNKNGRFILRKQAENGMTLAIYEEELSK